MSFAVTRKLIFLFIAVPFQSLLRGVFSTDWKKPLGPSYSENFSNCKPFSRQILRGNDRLTAADRRRWIYYRGGARTPNFVLTKAVIGLKLDHRADAFAFMHQIEGIIDPFER